MGLSFFAHEIGVEYDQDLVQADLQSMQVRLPLFDDLSFQREIETSARRRCGLKY